MIDFIAWAFAFGRASCRASVCSTEGGFFCGVTGYALAVVVATIKAKASQLLFGFFSIGFTRAFAYFFRLTDRAVVANKSPALAVRDAAFFA